MIAVGGVVVERYICSSLIMPNASSRAMGPTRGNASILANHNEARN